MQESAVQGWRGGTSALSSESSERHFGGSGRRVLALALLLFGVGILQQAYRLSLPTLGWRVVTAEYGEVPVLERNLLAVPSPLRPGDVLVGFEGQSLAALQARVLSFDPALHDLQHGDRLRVGVLREGAPLELSVMLRRWNLPAVLGALGSSLRENYLTLLGLLIAAFVFWQRPQNAAAQLMLLYYVGQFLIILSRMTELLVGASVADLMSPLSYLLALLFTHLLYLVLLAPLVLHLCLTFPDAKAPLQRRPWSLVLVYLAPWLMLALSGLFPAFGRPSLYLFAAVYSFLGSAFFVHTFMTVRDPLRRAQVRWVAFGFGIVSLSGVVWALGALRILTGPLLDVALAIPTPLILTICLGLAVLRYRLFDIDLIINRALVYGALTAAVVGLYIVVVGGLGALIGLQGNLILSLVGTGLVAVIFQPLRERLQGVVNRFMYGQRDEPYALLTRLSGQIGAVQAPEALLPALAKTLVETLELPYAGLFFYSETGRDAPPEVVGEYGLPVAEPLVFALEHQGEVFGELRLGSRSGGFDPKELGLLGTIGQQASVAAYTVRQTRALRRSHERLVAASEAERLRLRRDLHDGLGPTLAGLNLQLGALKGRVEQPEAMREGLREIQSELRRTAGEVRRIVHDLRPPSLDELGFKGALEVLVGRVNAERAQTSVSLELPDLPDLPPATEVALFCIVQEGLSNALKHAQAKQLHIAFKMGEHIVLSLTDDGSGFPETYRAGVGLSSMRERAEALGGRFEIVSSPQRGTTVRVEVPCGRTA